MKPLESIQKVLIDDLVGISKQCGSLWKDIVRFVSIVPALPAAMVKLRLAKMTVRIMTEAQKLSKQHHGKGCVSIMINNISCGIYWMETEFSVDSKENLRRQGHLIVSPEAMADVAEQLSEEVDSGQLAKAVTWLNRYELFTING